MHLRISFLIAASVLWVGSFEDPQPRPASEIHAQR